jgi:hypothetical protein
MDEHGRQQQGKQEEDVVEADPDVPDAFDQVLPELRQAGDGLRPEALLAAARGEHRAVRRAIQVQAQQAAVQAVELEQQPVAEAQIAG